MEQVLTAIFTSFIGGTFSLLSIWYTHHLQKSGHQPQPLSPFWPQPVNTEPLSIRAKIRQYRRWFWITVFFAMGIWLWDAFAPMFGYILNEYMVMLLVLPVYALQTYYLILYFSEVFQHRRLRRSGIWFGVLALLFGAVGSIFFAVIIAYVRYSRKKGKLVALHIAQNLKNLHVDDQVILQATGLGSEELDRLPRPGASYTQEV